MNGPPRLSAVIPTLGRETVLVNTVLALLSLEPAPDEVLVVDQTLVHEPETERVLEGLAASGRIRWVRLEKPSIPAAMNRGLVEASGTIVLFLDDDIVPAPGLVGAHRAAHAAGERLLVAGQVLQPWDGPTGDDSEGASFRFSSGRRQWVSEFPGGNFSVAKADALRIGGFDERFVRVAYRFEREFADRFLDAGGRILFVPEASLRHLKAPSGGTRTWGDHLRSIQPSHSVGGYYYLLASRRAPRRFLEFFRVFVRSFCTRFHLTHPWWIPLVMIGNVWAMLWAVALRMEGPALLPGTGVAEP